MRGGGRRPSWSIRGEHLPLLQLLMQDLESFVSLQFVLHLLVLHLLVLHLLVLHLPLQHLLVLCLCVLHLIVYLLCCKDANLYSASICQQSSFRPVIAFVSLQLELHLLMVHLLMVHLPMVHLHVLHLLAMHLIGLQLVQCLNMPTVVFRLQLIMHHCKPLGGSKQELEESKW